MGPHVLMSVPLLSLETRIPALGFDAALWRLLW
jgi:hypothetical protein